MWLLRWVAGEQNDAHMDPGGAGVFGPNSPHGANTGHRVDARELQLSRRSIRRPDVRKVLDMDDDRGRPPSAASVCVGNSVTVNVMPTMRFRAVLAMSFPPSVSRGGKRGSKDEPARKGLRLGMPSHPAGITQLLVAWGHGDEAALNRMIPLVHQELQEIARRCMGGERGGHSLQPTALVNEAYLRLVDVQQLHWQDRAHFLAMAARVMRRILVDHARAKGCDKRGGGAAKLTLDDALVVPNEPGRDLVALDDALEALARWTSARAA